MASSSARETPRRASPRIRRAFRRLAGDQGGASAIMVALVLPALIGFGALGAETGLWYALKGRNQSAADAAALAAAHEVINTGPSAADRLAAAANEAATRNGYTGDPPAISDPDENPAVTDGVSVTLRQQLAGILSSLMLPNVKITTTAVAIVKVHNQPCVLALSPAGTGLKISNAPLLDLSGCSAAANSTAAAAIDIGDHNGPIKGATLVSAGQIVLLGEPVDPYALPAELMLSSPPAIGAPPVADPYAGSLTHQFLVSGIPAAPAAAANSWNASGSIGPGLYRGGMAFLADAAIDLSPGVYYVAGGDFSVAAAAAVACSACAGGAGVTVVLTRTTAGGSPPGNVRISPGAAITLSAPAAGPFSGVLFVQDPVAVADETAANPHSAFEAGSRMNLTGLLYLPGAAVSFAGNPSATCTVLVANQVLIDGRSRFGTSGCAGAGLAELPAVNTSVLAE
jgi:Flp pilus assembly protein TadG